MALFSGGLHAYGDGPWFRGALLGRGCSCCCALFCDRPQVLRMLLVVAAHKEGQRVLEVFQNLAGCVHAPVCTCIFARASSERTLASGGGSVELGRPWPVCPVLS